MRQTFRYQNRSGFRRRDQEAFQAPGLFLASDRMLYLIAGTGLYQLTKKADAWTFVSSSGPNREFNPVMAERGDTLYVLTPNEVLASTDRGETWDSLGETT